MEKNRRMAEQPPELCGPSCDLGLKVVMDAALYSSANALLALGADPVEQTVRVKRKLLLSEAQAFYHPGAHPRCEEQNVGLGDWRECAAIIDEDAGEWFLH